MASDDTTAVVITAAQTALAGVLSCNRLGRQANPPGAAVALTNWWRRTAARGR
jgi:hypothetical protein